MNESGEGESSPVHEKVAKRLELPSLEGLSDAEYLERGKIFGQQWRGLITGQRVDAGYPILQELQRRLQETSERFQQIPEEERTKFLIEHAQTLPESAQKSDEPILEGLISEAEAKVVEVIPGIPAVLTNGLNTRKLFGYTGKARAFAFTGGIGVDEKNIPFVHLKDLGANDVTKTDLAIHEMTHVAWRIMRQYILGISQPQTRAQDVFMGIQDESISISTAGEHQLHHSGMNSLLRSYSMSTEEYDKIDTLYRAIVTKIDPQDLTLGIMSANSFQELVGFFERVSTAVEPLPTVNKEFGDYI